jgi:hypothetical protein
MTAPGTAIEPERTVWWVGDEALRWRETFVAWLSGDDSPRPSPMTWRIQIVGRGELSLPRVTTHRPNIESVISPWVVWAIPETGVADLVHLVDHVRRTRHGYAHITAGLVSPVERMILSEVGVAAHVQHPRDWSAHRSLLNHW